MDMFRSMNISSSALTMNRLRMDVISSNIANANTTRGEFVDGKWQPYRRKMVEIEAMNQTSFADTLNAAIGKTTSTVGQGVKVSKIIEDKTPFRKVFQPEHPDADAEGFLFLPNVDPLKEMVDLMATTKSYESNIASFNASKAMLLKTLEIGR